MLVRTRTAGLPNLSVTFPDHIHLIETEPTPDGVARAIGDDGGRGRTTMILDLPVSLVLNGALRDRLHASAVTVRASPQDEMLAASAPAPTRRRRFFRHATSGLNGCWDVTVPTMRRRRCMSSVR